MSNEALNGNFAKPMLAPVRVLNLYAGIGGNRKYWENVEVTAVEYNEEIAMIYKDHFPNDNVIVGDAHELFGLFCVSFYILVSQNNLFQNFLFHCGLIRL